MGQNAQKHVDNMMGVSYQNIDSSGMYYIEMYHL